MGRDGHTASLFPGTEALREKERLVVANWVPQLKTRRITMTLPVLNQAKGALFLVSGGEKAKTLAAVLEEEGEAEALPSRLIRPVKGEVMWLVDRSAAGLLKNMNRGE
jgi:6-phosphogluconolactonase